MVLLQICSVHNLCIAGTHALPDSQPLSFHSCITSIKTYGNTGYEG